MSAKHRWRPSVVRLATPDAGAVTLRKRVASRVVRPEWREVALCEDCGGFSDWFKPRMHSWHVPRCIWCQSLRVSRCETAR